MSVPSDIFETLPEQDYAAVRPLIRTGDIILYAGNDLASRAIGWGTRSPFSHVSLAARLDGLDRIMALQAILPSGTGAVSLSGVADGSGARQRPFDGRMVLARHDAFADLATPERLRAMGAFAVDRFGSPYSLLEILKIMARIALGWGDIRLPGRLRPTDDYICSEYVAACLQRVGITLSWNALGYIAPADIAADPRVQPIATIRTAL
ncbi:MAG: hypothetical protein KGL69_01400 [Alphaproteobacteria bacterium]|nr:hypothetical protein [Alphaproteobacteria bacterium]